MPRLTLRELECFLAVAETLSFRKAAESLHLSQPPLSRHIRTLEDKLGASLFVRDTRGVELTAVGERFLQETRDVLPAIARAEKTALAENASFDAALSVGFVSAILSPGLVETLRDWRRDYPGVRITLQDLVPAEQTEALEKGVIDIGLAGLKQPMLPEGLGQTRWRDEPLVAHVPGVATTDRTTLALNELSGRSFVAIDSRASPAYALFLKKLFSAHGLEMVITEEGSRAQAVAMMAIVGGYATILPESVRTWFPADFLDLTDDDGHSVSISHYLVHAKRPRPPAQAFIDFLTATG